MPESQFTSAEARNLQNLLARDVLWKSRLDVGNRLVELSLKTLRLAPKEHYIAIQPPDAETRSRRNAISLLHDCVSFAVPDWSIESKLEEEHITASRVTKFKTIKRLDFLTLTTEEVEEHLSIFTKLTIEAERTITGKRP